MKYAPFGSTGIISSRLIFGTWYLPHEDVARSDGVYPVSRKKSGDVIGKAMELGINTFDTADVYRGVYDRNRKTPDYSDVGLSEQILGESLRKVDRESVVLVTKLTGRTGPLPNDEGHSRKHVKNAISASLKRLQTDYVDVYLLHAEDPNTPLESSIRSMNLLIERGDILHYGVSNFRTEQIEAMFGICREQGLEPPSVIQDVYNLVHRNFEAGNKKIAEKYGMASMIYSPLAQGVLAGRYRKKDEGVSRRAYDGIFQKNVPELLENKTVDLVSEISESKGVSMAAVSLAWLMARGENIFPILGASKETQLLDSVSSVDMVLDNTSMEALNTGL